MGSWCSRSANIRMLRSNRSSWKNHESKLTVSAFPTTIRQIQEREKKGNESNAHASIYNNDKNEQAKEQSQADPRPNQQQRQR